MSCVSRVEGIHPLHLHPLAPERSGFRLGVVDVRGSFGAADVPYCTRYCSVCMTQVRLELQVLALVFLDRECVKE